MAYLINIRKENVYKLGSLISVENDQNPFFTANTSISFNWGGVSGKIGKTITTLKTRTHNEKVVDSLQFYMTYLQQGKYRKDDIYKRAPFYVSLEKAKPQVLNKEIGIRFISATEFEIFSEYETASATGQHYDSKNKVRVELPEGPFKKTFKVGHPVRLPFFNGTLNLRKASGLKPNTEFFIKFSDFNAVVNSFKNRIIVNTNKTSSSVLSLSLAGTNKAIIVDYLNSTSIISLIISTNSFYLKIFFIYFIISRTKN